MDPKQAEQTLTAIAKLFRLSRLYPETHPAVARATEELAAALPGLAARGVAEWKVRAQGFFLGQQQVLARNPALTELAQLLYSRGVRVVTVPPGVTTSQAEALIRVATGAAGADDPALRPIALVQGRRPSAASRTLPARGAGGRAAPFRPSRRAGREFRPDELPPDIDARRWLDCFGPDGDAMARTAALARLEELADALAELGDLRLTAEVVGTLDRASTAEDPSVPPDRVQALSARLVDGGALAGLVGRVGEPGIAADERRSAVQAVAALSHRAARLVADLYVAGTPEARAAYLAVARTAGERAVPPLLAYLGDAERDGAAAAADLLGATGSPAALEGLLACARHESTVVRERAVGALAEIGGPEVGRYVAPLLRDPAPQVRRAAVRALVAAHETGAGPLLLARLEGEEDEEVTIELLAALGRLGGPAVAEAVAGYAEPGVLRTPYPAAVRVAAARALAALGTPEAQERLRELVDDGEPEVRAIARGAKG